MAAPTTTTRRHLARHRRCRRHRCRRRHRRRPRRRQRCECCCPNTTHALRQCARLRRPGGGGAPATRTARLRAAHPALRRGATRGGCPAPASA
eukprot:211469-Chlamydomonas_euryale.AAC.1